MPETISARAWASRRENKVEMSDDDEQGTKLNKFTAFTAADN